MENMINVTSALVMVLAVFTFITMQLCMIKEGV